MDIAVYLSSDGLKDSLDGMKKRCSAERLTETSTLTSSLQLIQPHPSTAILIEEFLSSGLQPLVFSDDLIALHPFFLQPTFSLLELSTGEAEVVGADRTASLLLSAMDLLLQLSCLNREC